MTSVEIPNSVTIIERNTFNECRSLSSVYIPNSIKRIENGAFENCVNLMRVTIPNSVKYVDRRAFYGSGYYKANKRKTAANGKTIAKKVARKR